MPKELLVNVSRGEEVRVALVEDGRLEEIYLERDNAASNVGNIYLGKVTNVEGSRFKRPSSTSATAETAFCTSRICTRTTSPRAAAGTT